MKKKECHMIPEEEKRCVWMTTGLISYKLCVRDYACETCLFDQVMRDEMAVQNTLPASESVLTRETSRHETGFREKSALFYHPHHCWVNVENPDEVRIGINGILTKLVSRIKTVVLPQEGEAVSQGQCFAHIVQQKHILPLISPVTGTVYTVNRQFKNEPQLLARDPWEEGWLVTVKPENLENDLKKLLFGRRAFAWLREKETTVLRAGSAMLRGNNPSLGPTLQDGGEQVPGFVDLLSSEQFDQLIESLSRNDDVPA